MRKILLMIGAVLALATLGPVTEASANGHRVAVRTSAVHRVVAPVKHVRYAKVWHGYRHHWRWHHHWHYRHYWHHRWHHHHHWYHRWHYRHHWYHRCWCRC